MSQRSTSATRSPYIPPLWISYWKVFSTVIVVWDANYCFWRPRSMPGGDLAWIWAPYNVVPYGSVDLLYGWSALETKDGFVNAQSTMNIVEAFLNLWFLYLRHTKYRAQSSIIGFAAAIMTASKTILYFLQDSHTIPFLFSPITWILVPLIVTITLGRGIAQSLGDFASMSNSLIPVRSSSKQPSRSTALSPSPVKTVPTEFPQPTPGASLPITFHPRALPVLVIGSNRLAAIRIFSLLEAEAQVILSSPSSTHPIDELQWRLKQGQLQLSSFDVDTSDLESLTLYLTSNKISLVCVTDTLIGSSRRPLSNVELISKACMSLRIPLNVSDHPDLSTFTFPSTARLPGASGPSALQISVTTNGQGCRLATRIRREIVTHLPTSVGAAVDNVGRLRSRTKATVSDEAVTPLNEPVAQLIPGSVDEVHEGPLRRMRWVHQMSEYYSFDHLARMTDNDMDHALDTWTGSNPLPHHESTGKGKILLVGSGPGHPSLLTVAALHALRNSSLILSDKLVPSEIISLIPASTQLHIAKKFPGNAEGAQNELMHLALQGAQQGKTVVRLKQGDPFVYGRGGEEVLYFRQHGFEPVVIPGISSALAGPLSLGIPVTQRGVADSLIICTGVGRQGKFVQLPGYVKSRTLAILMGVARIEQVIEVLTSTSHEGRDGAAYPLYLPIAIIERASSPDQRALLSTLGDVQEALATIDQRPPGMMLIGWSVLCLEGPGQVDILDNVDEQNVIDKWLGRERWKVREGLSPGFDFPV